MKTLLIISLILCVFLAYVLYWISMELVREDERRIQEEAEYLWIGPYDQIKVVSAEGDTLYIKHQPGTTHIIHLDPCKLLK